ncbi:MAG: DUF4136 domain-containing protein [Bacteroidota bacterium]|nr:DUF4136 domain-containing protein [Bacteroidota bacterium]
MKSLKFFSLLAIVALFTSCSSVKVVTDMDKTVDFSKYETYSFLGWQEDSDKIMNDFDKKRVHDAFISEFEARGLKPVAENGDMAVSLFIVVDQKTSTTAYTNYYGGGYGGYNRYRGGWGYGHATTTYSESDYLEGTLVMDVFDGESKDQVWQGIATSTIVENPEKREKAIPSKVGALMKKFPVQPK